MQNKVCWFHCGFKTAFRQRFEICGSKKSICIDDLVLPANGPASFMLSSSALTKYDLLTFHERDTVEVDAELVHVSMLLLKGFPLWVFNRLKSYS